MWNYWHRFVIYDNEIPSIKKVKEFFFFLKNNSAIIEIPENWKPYLCRPKFYSGALLYVVNKAKPIRSFFLSFSVLPNVSHASVITLFCSWCYVMLSILLLWLSCYILLTAVFAFVTALLWVTWVEGLSGTSLSLKVEVRSPNTLPSADLTCWNTPGMLLLFSL